MKINAKDYQRLMDRPKPKKNKYEAKRKIYNGISMVNIEYIILGNTPSKSNCYKIIKLGKHASLAKTPSLKKYEDSFFMQIGKSRGSMIDEFFEFEIDVYYPSNRTDLDNSLKVVLDCLQACKVIKNDNKCTQIIARKFIDKNNPRIEFKIKLAK